MCRLEAAALSGIFIADKDLIPKTVLGALTLVISDLMRRQSSIPFGEICERVELIDRVSNILF